MKVDPFCLRGRARHLQRACTVAVQHALPVAASAVVKQILIDSLHQIANSRTLKERR